MSTKFLILIFFILLISCHNDISELNNLFTAQSRPEEKLYNLKTIYSDSAVVYFTIESKEVYTVRNQNENYFEYPKGIKISFLDKNKKATSWLEAENARDDIKSNQFVVKGNVRLYNKNNDKLQTGELIWDENNQSLYTNKFVRITRPENGDTLFGYGFRSNSAFSEFEIRKKFSGRVIEDMMQDFK